MYGYTVLCVLDDTDKTVEKENWELIVQDIEKQKAAIRYLQPDVNKPAEAVKIYPKFTDAYIFWALDKNNMKKFEPQKEILENALKLMPNNFKLKSQLARLYFQWDENTPEKKGLYSNNVKMAERLFQELIEEKPGNEESWFMLAMIEHKYKKNSAQAIKCLEQVMKMNPMRHAECVNNIAVICKEYV
jgi:tetratricopeptide (TPR) repeat protein